MTDHLCYSPPQHGVDHGTGQKIMPQAEVLLLKGFTPEEHKAFLDAMTSDYGQRHLADMVDRSCKPGDWSVAGIGGGITMDVIVSGQIDQRAIEANIAARSYTGGKHR